MSKFQFAATMRGRSDIAVDRYGTKQSGMQVTVGGWDGMVSVRVYHSHEGKDMFKVFLTPHWQDSSVGEDVLLAEGILDHKIDDPFVVPALFA